jgi:hypothetical protein
MQWNETLDSERHEVDDDDDDEGIRCTTRIYRKAIDRDMSDNQHTHETRTIVDERECAHVELDETRVNKHESPKHSSRTARSIRQGFPVRSLYTRRFHNRSDWLLFTIVVDCVPRRRQKRHSYGHR